MDRFSYLGNIRAKACISMTELLTNLGLSVDDDPLLEQSLYTEIHQTVVKEYFEYTHVPMMGRSQFDSILTDELNILRYACGYVARNLLKCYEKQSGEVAQ